MGKFYNINPETCTQEELCSAIRSCKLAEDDFNNKQLSSKIFINSVYGALANKFYYNSNVNMAESITLQGQDLIKYSVKVVNYYFDKLWPSDINTHTKIAEYMKKKFPDFDTAAFMERAKQPIQFGETLQIYGDSVTGDSLIHLSTGEYVTIEQLFNNECESDTDDKIRIVSDKMIWSFDSFSGMAKIYPIKYIMRHKTSHNIWKITTSTGNTIKVTNEHSIPVLKNNILINTKTEDISIGDDVICFNQNTNISTIEQIVEKIDLGNIKTFVYDIEVETNNPDEHYFFANNILVHNTDSVSKSSIVRTERHPEGITIEDFYNENINNSGDVTLAGHESVNTEDKVLNYIDSLNFNKVKRIIRHKVAKKKWKITTESGKTIECTDNHSLIVFRNGEKIKVKPSEIISTDKVFCISED